MDEELIQEYLRRFDQTSSLLKREGVPNVWYIELTEEELRHNQQDFANRMLQEGSSDPDVSSVGALICYGYRLGAVHLKGKSECVTRQGGYMDNAIWTYNLDEILDEEESNNPDASASHIIEWIINPGSNTDVSEAILEKMIAPIVKHLCKTTQPGKRTECTIVMPPISDEIEIQDWSSLFVGVKEKDLRINIVNYGQLLNLNKDERKYILQYQTDGYHEYVIVSAYEIIRGHNTSLGAIAFDVNDADRQYKLKDVEPISFAVDNHKENYEKKQHILELKNVFDYIECRFPVKSGFSSFLGNHEATFGREIYKLSGVKDEEHDTGAIRAVFHNNEALQVTEVCSRLLNEHNLYNIALGDLVYVANNLKRSNEFKSVSIRTKKDFKLGTHKLFASFVENDKLHKIPANYSSFSWKLRDKNKALVPYFELDAKKHTERQIIESIVEHFEHCSTETVADELLYLYKAGEDPSAYFVAKVFLYLSQLDSLEIESRNETITNIENVDDVEYQEIDKSHIKLHKSKNNKPATTTKMYTVFKQNNADTALLRKPIEELKFSVRTYNSLHRAGVRTLGELTKKSSDELLKVRNLGKKGQEEVIRKLREFGLSPSKSSSR